MSGTVLLVRHPPVARDWARRCYGRSDMGWSRAGAMMAKALTERLADAHPTLIVHSGMRRTEDLARMIAARTGAPLRCDARWRERDFGSWEGRTWHAIWRETGDRMDRMVSDPDGFRPGDGETTREMMRRVHEAWAALPDEGTVIVVTHGGPIAAVRVPVDTDDIDGMVRLIPAGGEVIARDRRD